MADPLATNSPAPRDPVLFAEKRPEPGSSSPLPWLVAAGVVLLAVLVFFVATRRKPAAATGPQGLPPYASSLAVSGLQMSESSALSGVKVTYIDGQIRNNGSKTVTDATAQVQFNNDVAMPPQLETVPVTLIRTHEPYIDTEPMSAAPLAPGQQAEFRLIFEGITDNWNQQLPAIRLVQVTTK